jgi:DNA-binding CsgD family transcriptional regulator
MSDASPRLRLRDVRRAFRLLGEIRALGTDPNAWRPHMVLGLRKLLRAHIVVSSEVHFRTMPGGTMRVIDIGWGSDADGKIWQIRTERDGEKPEDFWLRPAGATTPTPEKAHDESLMPVVPTRRIYGGTRFVLSQYTLPHAGAVDQLGLHRLHDDQPFTHADHRLVRMLHVELGRLWRRDVLLRVADPATDLPPRLTQTLHELAGGASEKQIALKLGLSRHTVHNYVKALHQRLGVSSRGELMARIGTARQSFVPRLSLDPPG